MQAEQLQQVLDAHNDWLQSGEQSGARADLTGAHLSGVDLAGCKLRGAFMQGAVLTNANLSGADLTHADLRDAQLQKANLAGANLLLTDFSGADLSDADLSHTTSDQEVELGHVRRGPRFKDTNLTRANLTGARCVGSDFSGSDLTEAQLREVIAPLANLSNLKAVDLDLSKADLQGANLSNSNLSETRFRAAHLERADLNHAILSDADLRGADLRAANLDNAMVDGVRYDRAARFKGVRVHSSYGSSRFRRFAMDQDFIEEFKESNRFKYWLWLALTDCGRSISRVVIWSAVITILFSGVYFLLGADAFSVANQAGLGWSPYTTLYYSVVTFTTLGFGDITPNSPLAATLVMVEVIVGYVMLGTLISILASKVARRS